MKGIPHDYVSRPLTDEQLLTASSEELADAALRDHRPLTDAERSAFAAAPIDFVRGNLIAPLIAARRAHNMEVADLYAAFEAARAPFRQPDGTIDVDGMTAEERAEFLQARYSVPPRWPRPRGAGDRHPVRHSRPVRSRLADQPRPRRAVTRREPSSAPTGAASFATSTAWCRTRGTTPPMAPISRSTTTTPLSPGRWTTSETPLEPRCCEHRPGEWLICPDHLAGHRSPSGEHVPPLAGRCAGCFELHAHRHHEGKSPAWWARALLPDHGLDARIAVWE